MKRTTKALRKLLRYHKTIITGTLFDNDQRLCIGAIKRPCSLMRPVIDCPGSWGFEAGLMPIVLQALDELGHPYEVAQPPRSSHRKISATPSEFVCASGRRVLDFIASNHESLLRIDRKRVDAPVLAAEIVQAFPNLHIVVAVTRRDSAFAVQRALRQREVSARISFGSSEAREDTAGVWISTYRGMREPCVELHRADLVIAVDALELLGNCGQESLQGAEDARLIGILDVNERLSVHDRVSLLQTFGPRSVTIVEPLKLDREVRAVFSPIDAPVVACGGNKLDIRRHGIYLHPARNRRIRHLCGAITAGDDAALEQRFPELRPAITANPSNRVLVLVKNLDHAETLARAMPGTRVVARDRVLSYGSDGVAEDHISPLPACHPWAPAPDQGNIVIATAEGMPRISVNNYDVMIRADGCAGLPPGLAMDMLSTAAPRSALVIVDFLDRHHPALRKNSRARERAYWDAGWTVGTTDQFADLIRFRNLTGDRS